MHLKLAFCLLVGLLCLHAFRQTGGVMFSTGPFVCNQSCVTSVVTDEQTG